MPQHCDSQARAGRQRPTVPPANQTGPVPSRQRAASSPSLMARSTSMAAQAPSARSCADGPASRSERPFTGDGHLSAFRSRTEITGIWGHPLTLMIASDTALRHCASRRSCHHLWLLTLQNPAPRRSRRRDGFICTPGLRYLLRNKAASSGALTAHQLAIPARTACSGRAEPGRRQQGESPKSSDDLPPSRRDPWRGHELADAHGQQGRAPRIQGETVTSPATGTTGAPDLPEYAPIPAIAKGAALNEHGYHVWQVRHLDRDHAPGPGPSLPDTDPGGPAPWSAPLLRTGSCRRDPVRVRIRLRARVRLWWRVTVRAPSWGCGRGSAAGSRPGRRLSGRAGRRRRRSRAAVRD